MGLNNYKEKLDEILEEYKKLCELLNYEEVLLDKKLMLNFSKQKQILEPISKKYEEYIEGNKELNTLSEIVIKLSGEEQTLFELEIKNFKNKILKLEDEIIKLLFNLNSIRQNIVVEISCSKEEISCQLLTILLDGFTLFAKENLLDFKLENNKNCAKIFIKGLNALEYFKNEIGFHKIISNNLEGFCQVFVYKIADEVVSFEEKDIIISTCRSSGKGGQHINTTDSAIKATHIQTGISAVCQDERSQFQNKQIALERLKEKVQDYITKQKNNFIEEQKKQQLKLCNKNKCVKEYNLLTNKIVKSDKQEILLKDFLQGKKI